MFAYFVPFILVVFLGRIIGPTLVVPGVYLMPILSILLIFTPQSIFEFRNSSLLKRIGTTPIKPWKFLLGISIFNAIIVITAVLFIFFSCFLIFVDQLQDKNVLTLVSPGLLSMIKNADWGGFIYSVFVLILLSMLIGIFISLMAKSTLFIQTTGIAILLISFFVGPCILPISLVGTVDVVKYLGYLIPLKYPISTAIESFTSGIPNSIVNIESSSIWDINNPYVVLDIMIKNPQDVGKTYLTIFNSDEKIVNLVLPWIYILIFLYLSSATFKWNNRGKITFRWNVIQELVVNIKNFIKQNSHETKHVYNEKSKNILEVKNLTKTFKTKGKQLVANNNITFNIKKGKNVAIVGHNGAGKSVLVETLVGVLPIQEGTIKYNFEYNKSFHEKIGIQFQDANFPHGIRCKDVVEFLIGAYKLNIKQQELNELIDKFGVKDFYTKNVSNLSGGQQQRINLLLSILHKPKILFLDELSTGLDIKIRNNIKQFIKKYAMENDMTIVIVSHDMSEVEYLANEIIVLKNGTIQCVEKISNIKKKSKSLEDFVYKYL